MTTFRFRLERVLRARRVAEEVQRARLFEAETLARTLEDVARDCSDASAASRDVLRSDQSAPTLDPSRILVAQSAHERVLTAEHDARQRALTAILAARGERAAWTTRRADVRGLERLEDRERETFREESDVREERVIEENASRRAEIARGERNRAARGSAPLAPRRGAKGRR